MSGKGPRYHRLVRGRRRLLLLSGALASLAGYVALAVLAAHQQFFAIDYGTRTWIRVLRKEAPYLPWAIVTELGTTLGVLLLIAAGMLFLLWRGQRGGGGAPAPGVGGGGGPAGARAGGDPLARRPARPGGGSVRRRPVPSL